MDMFVSVFPIVLLIYLMVKRNSWPSYIALPVIALLIYLIQFFYFDNGFMLLNANLISGLISTLTPITVIFGAILFNKMMEVSGNIQILRRWLSGINPNPIAQLMIIGWAFAFMIEGASGFGTPAAIAAPILVGLGFPPIKVAMLALVMNSVPVTFGAVGTPTWFGFQPLNLGEEMLLQVGMQSAIIHFLAGFVIPVIALRLVSNWEQIRKNIVFIYLSILSCTVPYVLLALYNYEFPSLVGGAIGLLVSVFLANYGIGLSKQTQSVQDMVAAGAGTYGNETQPDQLKDDSSQLDKGLVFKALLPTLLLILILVVTRIHQLGIKGLLNDATSMISIPLGYIGDLDISRALIIKLSNIFEQGVANSYRTLYVPSLIPFVVTVLISVVLFKMSSKQTLGIFSVSFSQIKKPFIALFGALAMVKFMLIGGQNSMVISIGNGFASVAGEYWIYFASYLGSIGAFFSGSNTVSNLTFGAIQYSIAQSTGLSVSLILALQSVGGAMGNMSCLNNIIAVSTVLDIKREEGNILKRTAIPMFIYGILAATIAVIVF